MNKRIFTMTIMLAFGLMAQAQTWVNDTVSMGAGYANDIYYSLKNGSQKVESNKNWHLGFSLTVSDSASVWANHNGGTSFVKVFNIHKDYTKWDSISIADTATANLMFNNDQGWHQGALNDVPGGSAFDFGWGIYDQTDNSINGDSIFIVRANGIYYKLCVKKLESQIMKWKFNVSELIGTSWGPTNVDSVLRLPNYVDRHFAYYNLATLADTNREPNINDWDIQFTRYTTNDPLSGSQPNNTVVGVLTNKGVTSTKVQAIHVDTANVHYASYVYPTMSSVISTIGYNWKFFNGVSFSVLDSTSYFIKDKLGSIYQLQFLDFVGQSSGFIEFQKRIVEPVSVKDLSSSINQYNIYPVPTSNELNVVLDSKESAFANIIVTDLSGKRISTSAINIQSGLNAYKMPISNLSNGQYILSIQGKSINLNQSFSVAK